MWNNLHPANPIHDICEYGNKDASLLEIIPNLISDLTSASEAMTEEHPIWTEIQIFGTIQAKYKRILHCDKSLQLLQRVSGCLRNMVLLQLSKAYLDLAEKFLFELQKANPESSFFLPSRQQLEYVLVRSQTAAKLICECLHYSREAFCYLIQRLKLGHLVMNLMMAISVTARLNIVFKGFLVQIFSSYRDIYKWREKLKRGGWEWPRILELPEDLEVWITQEESEYLKPKPLPKEQLDLLTNIFEKTKVRDDNEIQLLNKSTKSASSDQEDCMVVEEDMDTGVTIERPENGVEVLEVEDNPPNESEDEGTISEEDKETIVLDEDAKQLTDEVVLDEDAKQLTDETISEKDKETIVLDEDDKQLTDEQQKLLKKIKKCKTLKKLKLIWERLDVTRQNLFPKGLTPLNMRTIENEFQNSKLRITKLKKSNLSYELKEKKVRTLIQKTGLQFATRLGLLPDQERQDIPVKTFKELRDLYQRLSKKLLEQDEHNKCDKLKKTFKRRKADIKLLVQNGDKTTAREMIHSTSKLFLIKFS